MQTRMTGKQPHLESGTENGLYYYRARYHDSNRGRSVFAHLLTIARFPDRLTS